MVISNVRFTGCHYNNKTKKEIVTSKEDDIKILNDLKTYLAKNKSNIEIERCFQNRDQFCLNPNEDLTILTTSDKDSNGISFITKDFNLKIQNWNTDCKEMLKDTVNYVKHLFLKKSVQKDLNSISDILK